MSTAYYVSPMGSDLNNGTSTSTPFATVAKVNTLTMSAGDSVSFQGGGAFSGSLSFSSTNGSSGSPITITSYGTGIATINAGDSNGAALSGGGAGDGWGVRLTNCSHFRISNLKFQGSGVNQATGASTSGSTGGTQSPSNNTVGIGIDIVGTTTTGVQYTDIVLSSVESSGFYNAMLLRAEATNAMPDGYDNVTAMNCKLHDCLNFAAYTYGGNSAHKSGSPFFFYVGDRVHNTVVFIGCQLYNFCGDPLNPIGGGVGIQANNVTDLTVSHCVAHDGTLLVGRGAVVGVGPADYDSYGSGGGGGIIPLECTHAIVQYCEAYNLRTGLKYDACAFDLDGGVTNSIMYANYAHDCDGPGFQTGVYPNGSGATHANVFAYNVVVNCGKNPRPRPEGIPQAAFFDFGASDTYVLNNTFSITPSSAYIQPTGSNTVSGGAGIYFVNNLFYTSGGCTFLNALSGLQMKYYNNGYFDAYLAPVWRPGNGLAYGTLAQFQTLGDGAEVHGSTPIGFLSNPNLYSPLSHPVLGPSNSPSHYNGCDPTTTAPANSGVSLASVGLTFPAGITAPVADFHNIALASNFVGANTPGRVQPSAYGSGSNSLSLSL